MGATRVSGISCQHCEADRATSTVPAVLLGNHGLLAFGHDALYATMVIISMEEAAELTLETRMLGGEKPLPADALERERKHMQQHGSLR